MGEASENLNPFAFQVKRTQLFTQPPFTSSSRLKDFKDDRPLQDTISDYEKNLVSNSTGKRLITSEKNANRVFQLLKHTSNANLKLIHTHQSSENSMSDQKACQLCGEKELTFEPPIFCKLCGGVIKRNETFYPSGSCEAMHISCVPPELPKTGRESKINNEETKESWVKCDKCETWQHQICALFNGLKNDGGQQKYTCPKCYLGETGRGERNPLPQILGAKDLPRTTLSDHIELRLFKRLRQEKQERAWFHGKSTDEIPGAEPLIVRVVSSVDKKLEVDPRIRHIFYEENYPSEIPYKSKVILLFQEIEGAEVCIFGIQVQECGSECQQPNQRAVYISYIDSVKYFLPEIRTVSGEALRTFVYHEILIGYLEYCKLRGFTRCHIWACPPMKDDDYIFHCHPEIQKTPNSEKLREWFLAMLQKASKENIVIELTNIYDEFFIPTGESKAKLTASRLPYFDGDFWPGAARDIINQLHQEEAERRKLENKGNTKKIMTKKDLKAVGQAYTLANAAKDVLLMQKLGETICPMKEDLIVVHLQHSCNHCGNLMVSGYRWVCISCNKFHLCDECYGVEQELEDKDKHPINSNDKHVFHPVEVRDVAENTEDKDEILHSEFLDTRQSFLSLCRENHYQFNTLRRAKHSSMMVLFHLHNPTSFDFCITCNICQKYTKTGQIWRCGIFPDYDVCNSCFQKDGCVNHPHMLKIHPSTAQGDVQTLEYGHIRALQFKYMLDLLVHASQCRHKQCLYLNCGKVKGIFRHGIQCKVRAYGGCILCKKMWHLIQVHARACKESMCHVMRCRDLKEHLKRLQEESDTRRRASVMEMIRKQAPETVLNKRGHLSIAEAVLDKMEEDYYYVAGVVVEKIGHLSVAEAVLMDEHHSTDDEWICV